MAPERSLTNYTHKLRSELLPDRSEQMNGGTATDARLKILSPSGLFSILVALGIIFIGLREFLDPAAGARGYGVPLLDPGDGDLLAIKAARDVTSGILVLALLGLGNRKALACAIGVLTLIPVFDGLIVLRHAAWVFTPVIMIHWGTAAFMLLIVVLMRRGK
jgi:hypothetical protein